MACCLYRRELPLGFKHHPSDERQVLGNEGVPRPPKEAFVVAGAARRPICFGISREAAFAVRLRRQRGNRGKFPCSFAPVTAVEAGSLQHRPAWGFARNLHAGHPSSRGEEDSGATG